MTINIDDIKTPNDGKFILHCLKVELNSTYKPNNVSNLIKYNNLINRIKNRINQLENNTVN